MNMMYFQSKPSIACDARMMFIPFLVFFYKKNPFKLSLLFTQRRMTRWTCA